jgi:hypothetical protein
MFALTDESVVNHIGERKSRLEADDVERLEKVKREEEELAKQKDEEARAESGLDTQS